MNNLLWLPAALRDFGVKTVEYPGWKTRSNFAMGKILGVMIHHTGGNNTPASFIANHPQLGLCSQIHLNRAGTATIVGAGGAFHAGAGEYPKLGLKNNGNHFLLGIEANSDGKSRWPEVQLEAYYRICAAICYKLGFDSSRIIGHKEYAGKSQGKWDPGGINMEDFRKNVQKILDNKKEYEMLTNQFKSRVPGATVQLSYLDALEEIDKNTFLTKRELESFRKEILDKLADLQLKLEKG